jgi:hypothetical protein
VAFSKVVKKGFSLSPKNVLAMSAGEEKAVWGFDDS